ncbi:MAG: hypothetical protein KGZ50_01975 [Peptococcaceae bacterium]|nr:hypothetical protein [Peptococcaceae bacterium]
MIKVKVVWAIVVVIVITATAVVVSNRVFSPQEAGALVIAQIEIPGRFGIVGLSGTGPRNPKVTHTAVGGQEIVLTFSELLEPGQNLALMYLQMGHHVGIGGERAAIDDYYIEGNRLVVIARRGGIPTQFVSLFIPAGIRSAKGTVMDESVHIFFSTSALLGPHLLWNLVSLTPSETGQRPSLVIPRQWGDERKVMYAKTHTALRDASGKVARIIQAGENAHLLADDGSTSRVRLYRQENSPFAESIDEATDIYTSPFIQAEEGYVSSADLAEVPIPLNRYIYRKCRKAPCFSYGNIRHNLLENSMFFNRFKSFDCII